MQKEATAAASKALATAEEDLRQAKLGWKISQEEKGVSEEALAKMLSEQERAAHLREREHLVGVVGVQVTQRGGLRRVLRRLGLRRRRGGGGDRVEQRQRRVDLRVEGGPPAEEGALATEGALAQLRWRLLALNLRVDRAATPR